MDAWAQPRVDPGQPGRTPKFHPAPPTVPEKRTMMTQEFAAGDEVPDPPLPGEAREGDHDSIQVDQGGGQ